MDTTELQNLLTFTKQIIHVGKGDLLCGAHCLMACVEKALVQCLPQTHATAREQQQSPFEDKHTHFGDELNNQTTRGRNYQMIYLCFQTVQHFDHKRQTTLHSEEILEPSLTHSCASTKQHAVLTPLNPAATGSRTDPQICLRNSICFCL